MIEFFMGFFVGVTAYTLVKIANYVTQEELVRLKKLMGEDFDYNKIEKSLEDYVDSPNDPENFFKNFKKIKAEGTK